MISGVKHNEKTAFTAVFSFKRTTHTGLEAALRKQSGGLFLAVTEEFCEAHRMKFALMLRKIQEESRIKGISYGTRSSVKKTVRWTVFSGDRRFLQVINEPISTYDLQKSRRVPYSASA